MIRHIHTIRDEASGLYMELQINQSNDVAIRNFDFAIARNDMMNFRPEDFSLWCIGDYDDATGTISPITPNCLKRGVKKHGSKV